MNSQIYLFVQMERHSSCSCAKCEWLTLQSSLAIDYANSVTDHAC